MDLMVPDSGLMFWMIISFGILFFVLAKFGWPIITGMASRRKEKIEASLAEAKQAKELLSSLKEQGDQLVAQAREDQAKMVAQTAELRQQLINEARATAAAEGSKLIEQSKKQADAEREAAMEELRSYVALLSVDIAEKLLRQQLKADSSQTDLINRLIDESSKSKQA